MLLTLYRALGLAVVAGSLYMLGTGYALGGDADQIPKEARNSPGAYRSYFILYGGK